MSCLANALTCSQVLRPGRWFMRSATRRIRLFIICVCFCLQWTPTCSWRHTRATSSSAVCATFASNRPPSTGTRSTASSTFTSAIARSLWAARDWRWRHGPWSSQSRHALLLLPLLEWCARGNRNLDCASRGAEFGSSQNNGNKVHSCKLVGSIELSARDRWRHAQCLQRRVKHRYLLWYCVNARRDTAVDGAVALYVCMCVVH